MNSLTSCLARRVILVSASMFRFDGLTIAKAIIRVNRQNDIYHRQSDNNMIVKAIFIEIYLRGMLISLEGDRYGP
ncbi:hypothetical protein MU083_004846 [Escherichia coli]|uniref:hypothetical protein n=1 Tax=Escherichia coli TaxID=562 RepID=UPI000E1CC6F9|nr:hypothetical protein [Escherichia coli]EFE7778050.1 hypothetical protein [Escherichia coli]EFH5737196.1 hypothetical protein [Escherichia coli]EFJ3241757.1 hypothetical protein [Escherichia coli]EIA2077483.1 hypothetical protein [Escherichia coli]EID6492198.1 hypothetical protein [Escherichia coli]